MNARISILLSKVWKKHEGLPARLHHGKPRRTDGTGHITEACAADGGTMSAGTPLIAVHELTKRTEERIARFGNATAEDDFFGGEDIGESCQGDRQFAHGIEP